VLAVLLVLTGCGTVTNDAKSIIDEVGRLPLDLMSAKIARGFVHGLNDSLLRAGGQVPIDSFIRNLAHNAIMGLQDSLLDSTTRRKLDRTVSEVLDTLNSPHSKHNLDSLLSNLGNQVNIILKRILKSSGDQLSGIVNTSLLGDTTTAHLLHLRDTLLGGTLDSLITHVISTVAYGINHQITPALDTATIHTQSTIESTARTLAWIFGIAAGLLMILGTVLLVLKRRYQQMTEIMTQEIDKIPDQDAYDELIGRIHDKAVERKVEPHLQNVLKKQGLLGSTAWRPKSKKSQT
jgi:uncharacterized membrane protein affecting hemolysin expression